MSASTKAMDERYADAVGRYSDSCGMDGAAVLDAKANAQLETYRRSSIPAARRAARAWLIRHGVEPE